MKLYYSPGACSMSPHITASELGLKLELVKVDLKTHKLADTGEDYYQISPVGAVPALQLDDGSMITEGAVINQYLCDTQPGGEKLLPKIGNKERYTVLKWLNYVATELHKSYSPLFGLPYIGLDEANAAKFGAHVRGHLTKKYKTVEDQLSKSQFIAGDSFSIADAYLYTVTTWAKSMSVDLTMYPKLMGYMEKIQARPTVQATKLAEIGRAK